MSGAGAEHPGPSHRFAQIGELRLHALDFGGQGRPLILLHGVGGQAWMWHDVAPSLSRIGRVLALDSRGYGDSQWPADQAYETEDHAGDVAGWIERLGLGEVDVVGFSSGGLVALALATARPELVRRIAMIDIPPASSRSATEIPRLVGAFADHAAAVEAERRLSPRASEQMLEVMACHGTRPVAGGGLVRKHDPLFLERWPFRDDDRWDELRALAGPLLIVHAADSPVLSAEEAERMRAEARAATLAEIADCGHQVAVERPGALAEALGAFIER